jgi:hypothetical protein
MAGIRAARRIQIGKEDPQGTKVDATTIWRGIGTIQDNLETVFPPEDIGILTGTDRLYIPKVEAQLTLESTEATFEQLPYLFEMGIRSVTPTTDADSAGVYTYNMVCASTDILSSTDLAVYTFEGGDNQQEEEFAFGFVKSITLSGSAGGALMMSAEVVGRQVEPGAFTSAVAIPTVEEILFSKGTLSLDTTAVYPSTTAVSNTLLAMDLNITTGWTQVYAADGQLYFSFIKPVMPEVVLTVTFEHNTSSVAEKAFWRAGTARSLSVSFPGSTGKTFVASMVGKWESFDKLGEQDGNDIVRGTFRARYNSTAAAMFRAVVQNGLASLP